MMTGTRPPSDNRCAVAILAGGQSRRMGQEKADLPFGDSTMLEHLANRLQAVYGSIIVVGPHTASGSSRLTKLEGVHVVFDAEPDHGPLQGILAALNAAKSLGASHVFVTSCDAPLIHLDVVRRLIDTLGTADAVVPWDPSRRYPLLAVYHTRIIPVIESMLAHGQFRLLDLIDRVATADVPTQSLRLLDPQLISLINVNDPEDYQRALATLRQISTT